MKDNNRKCIKCGASGAQDPELILHRFPKPGPSNLQRMGAWAKFCFPEENWNSLEFQKKLYTSHKMLCSKHFSKDSYLQDHLLKDKLHRYAVPSESITTSVHISPVEILVPTESSQQPGTSSTSDKMAIVEDEVRNESEEENDIEVVVEEYDVEQDSDDSDDDDDAMDDALENKVEELERRIKEDPYNYEEHIQLIQALWGLSDLDRWRAAFERLQKMTALKPDHWLMRLQTEATLSHSSDNREAIAELFQQATLDCYSIQILSEWCSWSLSSSEPLFTRSQLEAVLRRAAADPLSGKVFWDAKLEFEKTVMDGLAEQDDKYKEQKERIIFCLEEMLSRPLLRAEDSWEALQELASLVKDKEYVDKVTKQHDAALDYLQKITPYEDKLLTLENVEEKFKVYEDYIETVKDLAKEDKYKDCDSNGVLKVLYERCTTECGSLPASRAMLVAMTRHVHTHGSRESYWRALRAAARRSPAEHTFWTMQMQQAEHEGKDFDEVKAIFETALNKGMESYKHAESLWLSYLEYTRRRTDFSNEASMELLRNTFRLAWDSLAEVWGDEANDCEVPLFWARLEYKRMNDHKRGKEIFEEIFKYGDNKTMSKYWEALIHLESARNPPPNENKHRELYRRALRCVSDYPPAIARLWTDAERDCGPLAALTDCHRACEDKLKEWRENYQTMKENMTGNKKHKQNKQADNKKGKFDKKIEQKPKKIEKKKVEEKKKKRKADSDGEGGGGKRKKDGGEASEMEKEEVKGIKRSIEDEDSVKDKETKRQRTDSAEGRPSSKEDYTLFVSNLDYKVDEQSLRDKLSQYGDIMSLRVRSGIKSFGGSICYCQYKNKESVDEAVKHDRTPLDGRPMFLSRYAAKKGKHFKYAMGPETHKLFVRNIPHEHCTREALAKIFDQFGDNDVRVVCFKDGKPKGLAYIEYTDEVSAAKALARCDGMEVGGRTLQVAISAPPPKDTPTLGMQKRENTGGMRRTQLSSFIPSVLQRASTSKATNGDLKSEPTQAQSKSDQTTQPGQTNTQPEQTNTQTDQPTTSQKRPMTNKDFRSMLLGEK